MSIRADLNKRGLEGDDLESMIDHFLAVEAEKLADHRMGMSDREAMTWASTIYGNDTARLVSALAAIHVENESRP